MSAVGDTPAIKHGCDPRDPGVLRQGEGLGAEKVTQPVSPPGDKQPKARPVGRELSHPISKRSQGWLW